MTCKNIYLLLLLVFIAGCTSFKANRYSLSIENIEALEQLDEVELSLGNFTSTTPNQTEIMCRGVAPVSTPDKTTFHEFIRNAFKDELLAAKVYAEGAPLTLKGNLDSIDFSTTQGYWQIVLTLAVSDSSEFQVTEQYQYETSFFGDIACQNTAEALIPSVQNLIASILLHPDFRSRIQQ